MSFESILDKIARKGVEEVTSEEWVDKAVERGLAFVEDIPDESLRVAARDVVISLGTKRHVVAHLGGDALTSIVSLLALGDEDSAHLQYIRSGDATYEEIKALRKFASDKARKAVSDREKAWDEVKKWALSALATLGKAAVPLLLSFL